MAAPVVRIGDVNSGGGVVLGPGALSVLVNGRPVITPGNIVAPHPCCGAPEAECVVHCAAVTTLGSLGVLAEGKPIVYVGSPDTCKHVRMTGSFNVLVGR
jgi:uncharacterized Zn-binding protein involved in type VI secretion